MALIDKINDGFAALTNLVKGKVDKTAVIAVAQGGTGGTNAATARSNLGLGTAATVNTGTAGGQVVLNGANASFSNLTATGSTTLNGASLGYVSATNGSPLSNYWFPRNADFADFIDKDYLDEFAFFDKRKNSIIIASALPVGGNESLVNMFVDNALAAHWTDSALSSLTLELDCSSSPITANASGYYKLAITMRGNIGTIGSIKVEFYNSSSQTWAVVSNNDGIWIGNKASSPLYITQRALSNETASEIKKVRITFDGLVLNSSNKLMIQRLMLYHQTAVYNPWHLHRLGGQMYGVTQYKVTSGNALEFIDSNHNVLSYIRSDGSWQGIKSGASSYKKGWRKLTATLPSQAGEVTVAHGVTTVETVQAKVTNTDGIIIYNNDIDPTNQFYVRVNGANLILGVTANSTKVFSKTVTIYVGEEL